MVVMVAAPCLLDGYRETLKTGGWSAGVRFETTVIIVVNAGTNFAEGNRS